MIRSHRIKTFALIVASLGLGTVAGVAYGASERYDSAKDHITKAIALLKAIENPEERPGEKIHRQLAIKQLEAADQQIDKAKAVADKPAPTPKDKKGKKDWKHDNDKHKHEKHKGD